MNEINKYNHNHTSLPDIDPAKLNLPETKVTDDKYVVQTIHVPLSLDHRLVLTFYLVGILICFTIFLLLFMGLTHKIRLLIEEVEMLRLLTIYDTASVQNDAIAVKQAAVKLEHLRRTEVYQHTQTQQAVLGSTCAVVIVGFILLIFCSK